MVYKQFIVFTLAVFSSFLTLAESTLEITLVEDPWPPYIVGVTGKPASGGTLVNLYKDVFEQLKGVKVNYQLIPWKRALLEVEQGKQDGIMALFKTPQREKVMDFTDPIFTGRTMLWYSPEKHPEGLAWEKLEDLVPYHILITRGSAMGKPLIDAQNNGVPLTISQVNNHQQQFDMISIGRGDITALTEIVGYQLLSDNNQVGAIIPMEKPLSDDDVYYLAFSKKSPGRKLIPQINSIIKQMRESGKLDSILRGLSNHSITEN